MCLYGFCLHFYLLLIVLFLNASKYCRSVLKNDFVVVLAVADELSKLYIDLYVIHFSDLVKINGVLLFLIAFS